MNSQTPRQQLCKAIQDNRPSTNDTVDAILAVFKGLPAMQYEAVKEQYEGGEPVDVRNDLREQILAELEGK